MPTTVWTNEAGGAAGESTASAVRAEAAAEAAEASAEQSAASAEIANNAASSTEVAAAAAANSALDAAGFAAAAAGSAESASDASDAAIAAAAVLSSAAYNDSNPFTPTDLTPITLASPDWYITDLYVSGLPQFAPDDWEQVGTQLTLKRSEFIGCEVRYRYRVAVPMVGNETNYGTRATLQAARPSMTHPVGTTVWADGLAYQVEPLAHVSIPDMPGLSAIDPTPQHYGAVGDGVTDDTNAFTRAAAANRLVRVPYSATPYVVTSSLVNANCMFVFEGGYYSTQFTGGATRHQLRAASEHNGQYSMRQLRIEPEKNTLTGSNEGNRRGFFIDMAEPNLASTDYGNGPWYFNEIQTTWSGTRTGSGIDGSETSSTVRALRIGINLGGADYSLQSGGAVSVGAIHSVADTSTGDKVAINGGVNSTASSPGKIYGSSWSYTIGSGGVTPQAVGCETDCFINGTGSVTNALGFNAWSGGEAQASNIYAAYGIGRSGAGTGVGWKTGFMLYTNSGATPQPIMTTGRLFAADGAQTLAHIFDFSNVTVTGNILSFPNFTLAGSGLITTQNDINFAATKGISFASSSDSVAAGVTVTNEKLTDYEDGAWTPTVTDGTNSVSSGYVTRVGKYTRIGRMVFAQCHVKINSLESVTGNIRIAGLPYTPSGDLQVAAVVGLVATVNMPSANYAISAYVQNGTDYFNLRSNDATTGQTALTAAEFSANGEISLTVSYPMA